MESDRHSKTRMIDSRPTDITGVKSNQDLLMSIEDKQGTVFFSMNLRSATDHVVKIGRQIDGQITGIGAVNQTLLGQFFQDKKHGFVVEYTTRQEERTVRRLVGHNVAEAFFALFDATNAADHYKNVFQDRIKVFGKWNLDQPDLMTPSMITSTIQDQSEYCLMIDKSKRIISLRSLAVDTYSVKVISFLAWNPEETSPKSDLVESLNYKHELSDCYEKLTSIAKENQPSFGYWTMLDGEISYTGEFTSGHKHGNGHEISSNGDSYLGEFSENLRHGIGLSSNSVGLVFMGEYSKGLRNGVGRLTSGNIEYIGHWKDGLKHGLGITIDRMLYVGSLNIWSYGTPSSFSFECTVIEDQFFVTDSQGLKGSDLRVPLDKMSLETFESVFKSCSQKIKEIEQRIKGILKETVARKNSLPNINWKSYLHEQAHQFRALRDKLYWIEEEYAKEFESFKQDLQLSAWDEIKKLPESYSALKNYLLDALREKYPDWRSKVVDWSEKKSQTVAMVDNFTANFSHQSSTATQKSSLTTQSICDDKENSHPNRGSRTQRSERKPMNAQSFEIHSCSMQDSENILGLISEASSHTDSNPDHLLTRPKSVGEIIHNDTLQRDAPRASFLNPIAEESCENYASFGVQEVHLAKHNLIEMEHASLELNVQPASHTVTTNEIIDFKQPSVEETPIETFKLSRPIKKKGVVEKWALNFESLTTSQKKKTDDVKQEQEIFENVYRKPVSAQEDDHNIRVRCETKTEIDQKVTNMPEPPISNHIDIQGSMQSHNSMIIEHLEIKRTSVAQNTHQTDNLVPIGQAAEHRQKFFDTLSFKGPEQSDPISVQSNKESKKSDIAEKSETSHNVNTLCNMLLNFNSKKHNQSQGILTFCDSLTADFKLGEASVNRASIAMPSAMTLEELHSIFHISTEQVNSHFSHCNLLDLDAQPKTVCTEFYGKLA